MMPGMNRFRVICSVVFLLLGGLVIYAVYLASIPWDQQTRRESIRILMAAKTSNELQKAVGQYGVMLTLSNGS